LQQQEAELEKLRAVLADAQASLKRAEAERQKWGDTLNAREVQLERDRAGGSLSSQSLRQSDEELRRLRRDKLQQQRAYEDRIHALLEKLGDLSKGLPAPGAGLPAGSADKTWSLEKQALQDRLAEAVDKVQLAEEKLENERADRLALEKQALAVRATVAELQEKLRTAEADLWAEKTRMGDADREKTSFRRKIDVLERELEQMRRETIAQEPMVLSGELISLRERVQDLETRLRAALSGEVTISPEGAPTAEGAPSVSFDALVLELETVRRSMEEQRSQWEGERASLDAQRAEQGDRLEKEANLRRAVEERGMQLSRDLERLRGEFDRARSEWESERRRLQTQWDEEKERRAGDIAAFRRAEERARGLAGQLDELRAAADAERARWQDERRSLLSDGGAPAPAAAPPSGEAGARAPGLLATEEDMSRLLEEIDRLQAENASLADEVSFLSRGGPARG
jgi:chromosome segregation ATPase